MLAQQSLHTRENMLKIESRGIFAPFCVPGVNKYSKKSSIHYKILGNRRVTGSGIHTVG